MKQKQLEQDKLLSKNSPFAVSVAKSRSTYSKTQVLTAQRNKAQARILKALAEDLGKPEAEAQLTELTPVFAELDSAIKNVKNWMKTKPVMTPLALIGSRSEIRYAPRGQVLIIAPWNYLFHLAIMPPIGAIAAGNVAVVKPSEISESTAKIVEDVIRDAFDPEEVICVQGDQQVATSLLAYRFDHIFFTGSCAVGKLVMQAAAKNLTFVTLELGGKSPAIVDRKITLKMVANRIAWGKFINAGQTCVAPDYVIVPDESRDELVGYIKEALERFYGAESEWVKSPDYCRIINEKNLNRLSGLLDGAVDEGAVIACGGERIPEQRFFLPHCWLMFGKESMHIAEEEIFGPILPILTYYQTEEIFDIIEKNSNPLALYVFL